MPDPLLRTAAIALGSNLLSSFGDRQDNLLEAVARLRGLGEVLRVSSYFDTAAELYVDQPRFLNAAALLRTRLMPEELMQGLLGVETAMGRVRTGVPEKGPRVIDLDLLMMDDLRWDSELVRLPHPGLAKRRFVLEPLAEIAPDWVHPELGASVREMLVRLPAHRDEIATREVRDFSHEDRR